MDGRRSSAALLFLALAAGSLAAVAQLHPPAGARYTLVALQTGRGSNAKLAMRTAGGMSITGFANGKDDWFALPGGDGSSRRGDIPMQGLGSLLSVLVNNNGTH